MADFSEVIEELEGNGFTAEEAVKATVALSKIPRIDEILQSPSAFDFVVETFVHGFTPSSLHQKAISEGVALMSDKQWECYSRHHIGGESMGNIARDLGVSKGTVQCYIVRAREKMKSAAKAAS